MWKRLLPIACIFAFGGGVSMANPSNACAEEAEDCSCTEVQCDSYCPWDSVGEWTGASGDPCSWTCFYDDGHQAGWNCVKA